MTRFEVITLMVGVIVFVLGIRMAQLSGNIICGAVVGMVSGLLCIPALIYCLDKLSNTPYHKG